MKQKNTGPTVQNVEGPNKSRVAVLREELSILTEKQLDAMLLGQLTYWFVRREDYNLALSEEKERLVAVLGEHAAAVPSHGFVYKSGEEWKQDVMADQSPTTILRAMDRLVDVGLVWRRNNPIHRWDRKYQYRPDVAEIIVRLHRMGRVLTGFGCCDPLYKVAEPFFGAERKAQHASSMVHVASSIDHSGLSMAQGERAVTETTTETTAQEDTLRDQSRVSGSEAPVAGSCLIKVPGIGHGRSGVGIWSGDGGIGSVAASAVHHSREAAAALGNATVLFQGDGQPSSTIHPTTCVEPGDTLITKETSVIRSALLRSYLAELRHLRALREAPELTALTNGQDLDKDKFYRSVMYTAMNEVYGSSLDGDLRRSRLRGFERRVRSAFEAQDPFELLLGAICAGAGHPECGIEDWFLMLSDIPAEVLMAHLLRAQMPYDRLGYHPGLDMDLLSGLLYNPYKRRYNQRALAPLLCEVFDMPYMVQDVQGKPEHNRAMHMLAGSLQKITRESGVHDVDVFVMPLVAAATSKQPVVTFLKKHVDLLLNASSLVLARNNVRHLSHEQVAHRVHTMLKCLIHSFQKLSYAVSLQEGMFEYLRETE